MKTPAVIDTGSLIVLHQLEILSLLRKLYEKLFIPEAVRDELLKGRTFRTSHIDLRTEVYTLGLHLITFDF